MARTRKTRAADIDAGMVTVVNSSSLSFFLILGVKIQYEGNAEPLELQTCAINPGTNSISLRSTYIDPLEQEQVVSWTLGTDQYGVIWRQENSGNASPVWQEHAELREGWYISEQWKIEVIPSGTYYLDNDPKNMLLTEPQFKTIESLLLRVLQQASPYSQMWSKVREQLPDEAEFGPIPEKLSDAYDSFHQYRIIRLPNWQNQYPLLELKANPNNEWVTQEDIDRGLALGGRAHIDVYWRALDRQPGGNADVHTVCYTFDCATQTVSTRIACNFEGNLERSEYKPQMLSDTIKANHPVGPFPSFLTALRDLGPGDSECTILDIISESPDEYDSTWTSHEIAVFLPRPWSPSGHQNFPREYQLCARQFLMANQRNMQLPSGVAQIILEFAAPLLYVPVIRLHQRCLLGPQWIPHERPEQRPEILPSPVQEAALTAARNLVGMGRVNTWTDAGDGQPSCEAKKDQPSRKSEMVTDDSYSNYLPCFFHPFYFDFPARNVAGTQVEGTSREWGPLAQQKSSSGADANK